MARWDNLSPSHQWLIQVDLAGHSEWMRTAPSKPDAARARAELAERMANGLDLHGFNVAFWAGDGGLFTAPLESVAADELTRVADEAFSCFNTWLTAGEAARRQRRDQLGLRLSMHLDLVYSNPNPGYWYSDELSLFLKRERELSEVGIATATGSVHQHLTGEGQQHWAFLRDAQVANGVTWRLYSHRPPAAPTLTGQWLLTETYEEGHTEAQVTLTQRGSTLMGRMEICDHHEEGLMEVDEKVAGHVDGNDIRISGTEVHVKRGDPDYELDEWFGTLIDPDTIEGHSRDRDGMSGTFIMRRKKSD